MVWTTCKSTAGGWNQKFLDYEIETAHGVNSLIKPIIDVQSWNQKFLDYEIETSRDRRCEIIQRFMLESKVSRLRD